MQLATLMGDTSSLPPEPAIAGVVGTVSMSGAIDSSGVLERRRVRSDYVVQMDDRNRDHRTLTRLIIRSPINLTLELRQVNWGTDGVRLR